MSESNQFCTFYINGLYLGVEVLKVQEVILYQEMTEIPLSSDTVQGLINLRGQIVTAIDLRRRLGMAALEKGQLPKNVVIRTGDEAVSFLVDEIGDVVEVEPENFERPPETLQGEARRLIKGVFKLEDRLLLILDVDQTITFEASA